MMMYSVNNKSLSVPISAAGYIVLFTNISIYIILIHIDNQQAYFPILLWHKLCESVEPFM